MKLSRHFCDFCGNPIKAGDPVASFSVPPLRDGSSVDRSQVPARRSVSAHEEMYGVSLSFLFGASTRISHATAHTNYDVCMDCARSFLVARFTALKRAAALMNEHAASVGGIVSSVDEE